MLVAITIKLCGFKIVRVIQENRSLRRGSILLSFVNPRKAIPGLNRRRPPESKKIRVLSLFLYSISGRLITQLAESIPEKVLV
jgi:hypothetical protein